MLVLVPERRLCHRRHEFRRLPVQCSQALDLRLWSGEWWHCPYVGADIATSCSYQASFQGFEQMGISRQGTEELLRRSVRLADAARNQYSEANADSSFTGLATTCSHQAFTHRSQQAGISR